MIITLELLPHQNGNAENGTSSGNGKSGFSFSGILNLSKCQFYSSDSFGEKEATLAESVSLHPQAEAIESACRISY